MQKPTPESSRSSKPTKPKTQKSADAGTKYFTRTVPLPSELDEIWRGTGPELPPGYEGGEACPDCSAFKGVRHAPYCIRNPMGGLDITEAWQALRTKVQIFFGAGHPIGDKDFDSYMTVERQKKLQRAAMVVMYDFPAGDSRVGRSLLNAGEIETRSVIVEWKKRSARVAR